MILQKIMNTDSYEPKSRAAQHTLHPLAMFSSVLRHRDLVYQLARRDVVGRYRGSVLGVLWSLVQPLIMLAVYTFVFSVVFQVRWNATAGSKADFALALFVGLIAHGLLSDCLLRGPRLVLDNPNYVTKILFPLEILPWVLLGSSLFHTMANLLVWFIFFAATHHTIPASALLTPVVFLPLCLLCLATGWSLASLGVYFRDVGHLTGLCSTVLLFLSPVFFPADRLPLPYRQILYANPLTYIIETLRQVLISGDAPDLLALCLATLLAGLAAWGSFVWFQKTRNGFADVL